MSVKQKTYATEFKSMVALDAIKKEAFNGKHNHVWSTDITYIRLTHLDW